TVLYESGGGRGFSYSAGCKKPFGTVPYFQRTAFRESAQLSQPNLSHQNDRDIRPAEALSATVGNGALSFLRNVILNVHDIRSVFLFVNRKLTSQNRVSHFPRGGKLCRRRALLLTPLPITLGRIARNMNEAQIKACVGEVVNRHTPGERVAPFLRGF